MAETNLFFTRYELEPVSELNSVSNASSREGALLRIEENGRAPGYADLHPWPELGDADLKKQLDWLKRDVLTEATRRSLEMARMDSIARSQGRSLFYGMGFEIPESHFLVTHLPSFSLESLKHALSAGFSRFKMKAGRDPAAEGKLLLRLAEEAPAGTRFRVDFNASLDREGVELFLNVMKPKLASIDFLEDPMAWDPEDWSALKEKWGVRLACDFEQPPEDAPGPADFQVVKPALTGDPRRQPAKVVFSSYLDHPVGQVHAAIQAARFFAKHPERSELCGLVSQHAYRATRYSELLGPSSPRLRVPEGTGIGFDALLEREKWEVLA